MMTASPAAGGAVSLRDGALPGGLHTMAARCSPKLLLALLLLAAPLAHAKKKRTAPEVTVEFTEAGPLGLDFSLEKLAGANFGLAIKGIADGSHAAAFPQL